MINYAVKRCSEFEALGVVETPYAPEAINTYLYLRKTSPSSIPSIGLVNSEGSICDVFSGNSEELDNLKYYFSGKELKKAEEKAKKLAEMVKRRLNIS